MTQHKNGISVLALRRQLGVSYNTAWLFKQKLMQAMVERDGDFALGGIVQMDDAYWGGERHGGGTGRGAARAPEFDSLPLNLAHFDAGITVECGFTGYIFQMSCSGTFVKY